MFQFSPFQYILHSLSTKLSTWKIQTFKGTLFLSSFTGWKIAMCVYNLAAKKSSFSFLAFDFCLFCVIIRFFHPRHNSQLLRLRRISIPDFIHYIFCPIFILLKEPVFPFLMLSAIQGNYWYHFYNVFGMMLFLTGDWTRDLPHSKPALYH